MSTPNQPGTTPTDRDAITAVIRAFYEPFRTGDATTYRDVLAEGWIDIPLAPGQQQGPEGMAAQIALFRQAMPDYDVRHEDLIVDCDRVAVRNTVSGTHLGAFMGHQPTGRRIEMRTMDVHRVEDGRIVTTWHLEDFAGLMRSSAQAPRSRSAPPGADPRRR